MEAVTVDLRQTNSVEEALEASNLNWTARPEELITGSGKPVNTRKAICRDDTGDVIGVVGNQYKIVQNSFAFAYFDTILQHHNAHMKEAIIYDGGVKVMLKAHLNGGQTIVRTNPDGSQDEVMKEISLLNSFDGSTSLKPMFSIERLICTNGLRGLVNESYARIYHSQNLENQAKEALKIFNQSQVFFDKFIEQNKRLAQVAADKKMVENFLDEMFPFDEEKGISARNVNNRDSVVNLFKNGKGNGGDTVYDLLNGFTEHIDHASATDDSKRLASATIGNGAKKKEQAFEYLYKVATI